MHSRYRKIVEWSEEDGCYVGTCPELLLGGVHGQDEVKVYRDLVRVVDEWERSNAQRAPRRRSTHKVAKKARSRRSSRP